VPSRRHRDRCYATDIEVGFRTTEISLHIGPTSEYSKNPGFILSDIALVISGARKKVKI